MKQNRVSQVLKQMKEDNIPQILVSDPLSIFYLTGLFLNPGERLFTLYLNVDGNHKLFVNALFPIEQDLGVEKVIFSDTDDSIEILSRYIDKSAPLGVDKNWPARFLLALMDLNAATKFVNASYIIDLMRMFKDEEEIDLMRKSSILNDKACETIIGRISADKTEKQIASELINLYEEMGAEGLSFDPIIGMAANGANPHGEPGDRKPNPGDAIIVDMGCKKDMYCSDMTRTVFWKEVSEKGREVFEIVLEANKRGIAASKPGARFCDIDAACRDYITEMGYGEYFTHRTGHHIGLEDHDYGDVSSINTDVAKPGMIFSIEPGIYLPGEFGVRVEDLVLITEDGCEVLNKYDKELMVIGND
ncbi:M24 family metallopeptidase [Peptostreptococcus faecalis]|uniref:M24 family metallopeptidase n=1 Tax=Peptostreptococcus faecalis TaxID=2045015 RepID=UPI000C7A12BB|nr:Xaa-Pro peptidase family protein [Peptostreptococcus faecalis]